MKSTMKSAFAFIAVAMMIMVAVVPMVSVFTEDSSAASTIVPATTKSITVSGTVKDSDSQKIKDALIEVSDGTYKEYGLTDSNGAYSIVFNYVVSAISTSIATMTVKVVIDDAAYTKQAGEKTNPAKDKFTSSNNTQTISSVSSNVSGIDFMSGKVAISGKLTYANTTQAYETATSVTITPADTAVSATSVTSGADGTYSALVPVDVGKVKITASGFDEKEVTVAKTNVTTGADIAKKDTYKIFVTFSNVFKINTISVELPTDTKVKTATLGEAKSNKYPLVYEVDSASTATTTTVLFKDSSGYMWDKTQAVGTSDISLTEDAYVTGSIKMDTLLLEGTSAASIADVKFFKDATDTEKTGTATLTGDGKYVIALSKITDLSTSGANKVKFKATLTADSEVKKDMDVAITLTSANTGKDVVFAKTGFYLISGTIKSGTSPVAGVKISVTSSNAVGLVDNKVTTGTDGKYRFYAKSGQQVTIAPDVTCAPSSQVFTAIADKTVDFTMASETLKSSAIQDAEGKPLKGVAVKYKIGATGTYADAVFDDATSTYSVTVSKNVTATGVFVYFIKAGYTFSDGNEKLITADNPVAMTETNGNVVKANEQTLTFTVADAADIEIEDISDITFQVAKYKIHSVAFGVNAFDIIGTASDVTYDATTKTFSFVAEKLTATGDYRTQYGISVKSNTTDYTFAAITEFGADNFVIKANEQTYKGKVTDATGTDANALKGMTVAVYDSSAATATKISGDVTTLNDGSFTVVSKAGYVKVIDPEGVYTFAAIATAKGMTIKANEQTYEGTVKDADGDAVKNANITVAVFDTDGEIVGSIATVAKDGSYEIVTKLVAGYEVVTVDADNVRTFKDVKITDTSAMPAIKSGQCTISGKVTVKSSSPETPLEGITVTLSIYSTTVDPVVVDTAVTDAKGEYSFFVDVAEGYGVVATNSGDYIFSAAETKVSLYKANITTEYEMASGTVIDAASGKLAGINVKVTNGDVVVGNYVSDANGQFKYPSVSSSVKFEAVDPNGVYTFAAGSLTAKEKTFTATVVSGNVGNGTGIPLEGITVNFLKDSVVVKSAVTDETGKASVVIAACNIVAAVDGNTKYGAVTFAAADVSYDSNIVANESIYSGYYANGDVISGVTVTYQISNGGAFVEKGKATVIDNKYYIVTAKTGDKIIVDANAEGFYATATFDGMTAIGAKDLVITPIKGVVTAAPDRGLNDLYFIYNYANAQVGDKILLSAVNAAFLPLEDENETTVLKYVFKGWYVNGEKISDDLEYTYTVTGECIVYADYEVSSYGATPSPSNGVDSTTLAIGIAAVIIALIAVVYAVIQKKKE